MNKDEVLEQFDRLFHDVAPLILFSNVEASRRYVSLLSSFYVAYMSNNSMLAKEIREKLDKKIDNSLKGGEKYTIHERKRIMHFRNSFLSLEERVRNLESEVDDLAGKKRKKSMRKREDSVCAVCQEKLVNSGKYLECVRCGRKFDYITLEQVGFRVKCDECGHIWTYSGTRTRGKCNECDKSINDMKKWKIEYD